MDKKFEKLIVNYDKHCQTVAKATQVKLGEKPGERAARIRRLEANYIDWFEYHFPHYAKAKCAKYHKKMADNIIQNKKCRSLNEIYRSGAKSVHVDMGIPLFLYVTKQLHFMLLMGETADKAKQLLGDIQAELEYNQKFQNDYGRKFRKGDWSDGDFYTVDGVRFKSLGFGQSPRGLREGAMRPDYIVVDDVDAKKHINNDRIMRESIDYIMEEVMGCFDSSDDSIERFVFANNNFHKNSITNRLKREFQLRIKADKEEKKKSRFVILSVPAVKDLNSFEPTWPEKTTAAYWREKYKERPRSFLREYMHIHVVDGKIFKPEHMQWTKMLAMDKYDAIVMYGDLSYKDQGDYKAMFLVGKTGKEFHIISCMVRQCSRNEAANWLYDTYEKYKLQGQNVSYKIEGLFAMDEFISEFDNVGEERGYYIPVIADKRGKINKEDRIESLEPFFLRHWVFWNEKEKDTIDQSEAIDQLIAFEKGSGAHDDAPDALHGAMNDLNMVTFVEKFEPRFAKRQSHNERF